MEVKTKQKRKSESTSASNQPILLMGNIAAAHGLIQAKVGIVTAYPGTPSTEIQTELYKLSKKGVTYFEFSINEKVAFEIAAAAALSGVRSAVIMKHVGLNVASDSMNAMTYFGVQKGMLIIVADDPGCLSSQNEQDSRYWGRLAHLPVIEPATGTDIVNMIQTAYEISERYRQMVIFRLTNFSGLNTSLVQVNDSMNPIPHEGEFVKDVKYAIPARYLFHKEAHAILAKITEDPAFSGLNTIDQPNMTGNRLIVTQGAIYPIVEYMRNRSHLDYPILKISAIYPLSEEKIAVLIKKYAYIYCIEELEGYLEHEFQAIIGKKQLPIKVLGKNELNVPQENRITPDVLQKAFQHMSEDPEELLAHPPQEPPAPPVPPVFNTGQLNLPRTLPRLCDGCPHRGAFYVIKKATQLDDIIPSDIGCYALGQVPPVTIGDFWLCMGGGMGTALGFSLTTKKPVIAIIGDGTFFHAGVPPLLDAVLYNHKITVAILNNHLTAMTGGQPSANSPPRIAKNQNPIDLEQLVKGCGVKFVRSVSTDNLTENLAIFKEALAFPGPAVVIFNGDCVIDLMRYQEGWDVQQKVYIDTEVCTMCGNCLVDLSCPSIIQHDSKIAINQRTCIACNLCRNVCPSGAIKAIKS